MINSGAISSQQFYEILTSEGSDYTIIDVRGPGEIQSHNVAGVLGSNLKREVICIPLNVLRGLNSKDQIETKIPSGNPVLCLCRSGMRSSVAQSHLISNGFEAVNVGGGILGLTSYAGSQ